MTYPPAERPTIHFIGVTTGHSSILKVFPAWAKHLGLHDAAIHGIDFPLHADPAAYREAVTFIKHDPLTRGALVTTHKIDLFNACRDLFDDIDPLAALMHETSCLSKRPGAKRDGRLICHAKDPISAGLALDAITGVGYFQRNGADVFLIGAGGGAIAATWHLMRPERGDDLPRRIVVSNRSPGRLEEMRRIHAAIASRVRVEYVLAPTPADNDAVLAGLADGSLVINATGLGKDAPGSPLSDAAVFPRRAIAWDFNYRGELVFLEQARRQRAARALCIEDGWTYFIHGWTQVIAEVFAITIPTSGPTFEAISAIALDAAKA